MQSETSGNYGKLVGLALAPKDDFFADIIDKACGGMGASEITLIELFIMSKNEAPRRTAEPPPCRRGATPPRRRTAAPHPTQPPHHVLPSAQIIAADEEK